MRWISSFCQLEVRGAKTNLPPATMNVEVLPLNGKSAKRSETRAYAGYSSPLLSVAVVLRALGEEFESFSTRC